MVLDADARGPNLLPGGGREAAPGGSGRPSSDPEGHHDWVIDALVDIDASDEAGERLVLATALRRLDGS